MKEDLDKILEYYKLNRSNTLNINTTLRYKINHNLTWNFGKKFININIQMNDIIYTILNNIDNKNTIKEIFEIVRKDLNINNNDNELLSIFKPIYEIFELYDLILLKS